MTIPVNLIGTRLGNYRLERLLGRGRMGVVYLAQDDALLRPTAVKVLSWTISKRYGQSPEAWFLSEARSMARINHPNVVQIYAVGKHTGHCYIAMEYVNGAAADALIARHGPFSPQRATDILVQVAGALQAAHDASVVHCDIKPENLLIGADGTAKLGDFGMSRRVSSDKTHDHEHEPVRAGTPFYTAPEIWRGEAANPATDLYALGATYFYLLTGRPPLEGVDMESLKAAHLQADVPDVHKLAPNVPPACGQIVRRCLAKSARDRYTSAQVLGWDALGLLRS